MKKNDFHRARPNKMHFLGAKQPKMHFWGAKQPYFGTKKKQTVILRENEKGETSYLRCVICHVLFNLKSVSTEIKFMSILGEQCIKQH